MKRYVCAVALCGLLATAQTARAQELLNIFASTRVRSMGQNGVADNSDPGTTYFNPANVVDPLRLYVQGWGWDYKVDFGYGNTLTIPFRGASAGSSFLLGSGRSPLMLGIDVSYAKLDFGKSEATLTDGTPLGTFDNVENYAAVALGMGRVVGGGIDIRLGAAAKRWWADYPPALFTQDSVSTTPEAFAFDAGMTIAVRSRLSGWSVVPAVAIAGVNMGSRVDYGGNVSGHLPERLNFGTSVRVESSNTRILFAEVPVFTFVCNVDATKRFNDQPNSWGLGMEVGIAQILFLRAGSISYPNEKYDRDSDDSGWGAGIGLPIGRLRARLDYGHDAQSNAPDQYGFSLSRTL